MGYLCQAMSLATGQPKAGCPLGEALPLAQLSGKQSERAAQGGVVPLEADGMCCGHYGRESSAQTKTVLLLAEVKEASQKAVLRTSEPPPTSRWY